MNNYKYTNIKQKRHFNLDVFKNEIPCDLENKNNFDPFLNKDYVIKYHNQFDGEDILNNLKKERMLKYSLNMIIIYVSKRKLILNDQLCEIIKEMLILLKKSSDTPQDMILLCFCQIIAVHQNFYHYLNELGIVDALVNYIQKTDLNLVSCNILSYLIFTQCQGNSLIIIKNEIYKFIPFLTDMCKLKLSQSAYVQVVENQIYCLKSLLTMVSKNSIQLKDFYITKILITNVQKNLIDMSLDLHHPGNKYVSNLIYQMLGGNDNHAQILINAGVFKVLQVQIKNTKENNQQLVFWAIGNLFACQKIDFSKYNQSLDLLELLKSINKYLRTNILNVYEETCEFFKTEDVIIRLIKSQILLYNLNILELNDEENIVPLVKLSKNSSLQKKLSQFKVNQIILSYYHQKDKKYKKSML